MANHIFAGEFRGTGNGFWNNGFWNNGNVKMEVTWVPTSIKREVEKIILPIPKHIYYNEEEQITTVLWEDGTKTMVKLTKGEKYAADAALGYALMKKVWENRTNYMRYVNETKVMKKKVKVNKNNKTK